MQNPLNFIIGRRAKFTTLQSQPTTFRGCSSQQRTDVTMIGCGTELKISSSSEQPMPAETLIKCLEAIAAGDVPTSLRMDNQLRLRFLEAARMSSFRLEQPWDTMQRLIFCALPPNIVQVGIDLGLWRILATRSKVAMNVKELAIELGAESNLLLRLLRYAATQWMVEQVDVDAFRATDVTHYLCMSGLESVVFHVTEKNIALYNAIPKWLAENSYRQPQDNKWLPFNLSKNTSLHFFEWLSQRPRHQQAFNEYMSFQRVGQQSWLDAFPLEKYMKESNAISMNRKLVVDVGGGYGHQCQEILKRFPGVRGRIVLQDTHMAAIDCAKKIEGLEVVHHDFTNAQPVREACVYYLRNILHDWPDRACHDILRHLKGALASDSVILLDGLAIQEGSGHWYGASFDLLMMANYGARERSLSEWDRILEKAGLERKEFIPYSMHGDGIQVVVSQ